MTDLRRLTRLLSAALVVALAVLVAPAMAAGADVHYVAQETTPEGVVLPDEEERGGQDEQDAQEDEAAAQESDEQRSSEDESAQDDDSPDREQSAGGSGDGDGGMPNTGIETVPLAILGMIMLASGVALRHKTRRRRRMRW